MKKIYLAGRVTGLTPEQANEWRVEFTGKVSGYFECINPLRNQINWFEKNTIISKEDKKNRPMSRRSIIKRDMQDIQKCDILVANGDAERGTTMEIFYAGYVLHIPVFVFNCEKHSIWIDEFTTQFFKDIEELAAFLIKYWS